MTVNHLESRADLEEKLAEVQAEMSALEWRFHASPERNSLDRKNDYDLPVASLEKRRAWLEAQLNKLSIAEKHDAERRAEAEAITAHQRQAEWRASLHPDLAKVVDRVERLEALMERVCSQIGVRP
jgi:chromosome segregation ATPase